MNILRAVNISALLLTTSMISSGSAAEPATDEVLQKCRALLSSERGANIVDRWSKRPLPHEYRQVAGVALQNETVGGWIAHMNPNRILTVVIHAFDPETQDGHFVILVKDKRPVLKDDVSAFEFALSSKEQDGMTGLFFCSKTGPSAEWIWNGVNWKIAK